MVGFDRIDSATRVVNAAPETVFAAFVDPQAIAQWLPPTGATATVRDYEPWAGGSIKLTLTFDEGVDGRRRKIPTSSKARSSSSSKLRGSSKNSGFSQTTIGSRA